MEDKTPIARRAFVAGAAAMGSAAVMGLVGLAQAAEKPGDKAPTVEPEWHEQVGFWVETDKCQDCGTCAHACRRANETPEDEACRRKILICEDSRGKTVYVSTSCMHCSNPSCANVCPAGAIKKRETDGVVWVDKDLCIGCRYCYQACPFGVPHYTHDGMDKCDCCMGNGIYPGHTPACADACPHDALHFGGIEELRARAGKNAVVITGITGPSFIVS